MHSLLNSAIHLPKRNEGTCLHNLCRNVHSRFIHVANNEKQSKCPQTEKWVTLITFNVVLVLPYIDMNLPRVYSCSPSWTPSHLSRHPIPLGNPSAPAPSILYHALNLDWQSVSHMIIYMFQCYSLKSSHHRLLPQSPKICSLHLCLFCCLTYKVIITIFLNSIKMC